MSDDLQERIRGRLHEDEPRLGPVSARPRRRGRPWRRSSPTSPHCGRNSCATTASRSTRRPAGGRARPPGRAWSTATPAAMPEANASAPAPPSSGGARPRGASASGFDSRMYVCPPSGVSSRVALERRGQIDGRRDRARAASGRRVPREPRASRTSCVLRGAVWHHSRVKTPASPVVLAATLTAFPLAAQAPTPSKPDVGQGLKRERERLANYQWRLRTEMKIDGDLRMSRIENVHLGPDGELVKKIVKFDKSPAPTPFPENDPRARACRPPDELGGGRPLRAGAGAHAVLRAPLAGARRGVGRSGPSCCRRTPIAPGSCGCTAAASDGRWTTPCSTSTR